MGLTAILRESWDMSQQPDIDRREKIQALFIAINDRENTITSKVLFSNGTDLISHETTFSFIAMCTHC